MIATRPAIAFTTSQSHNPYQYDVPIIVCYCLRLAIKYYAANMNMLSVTNELPLFSMSSGLVMMYYVIIY